MTNRKARSIDDETLKQIIKMLSNPIRILIVPNKKLLNIQDVSLEYYNELLKYFNSCSGFTIFKEEPRNGFDAVVNVKTLNWIEIGHNNTSDIFFCMPDNDINREKTYKDFLQEFKELCFDINFLQEKYRVLEKNTLIG